MLVHQFIGALAKNGVCQFFVLSFNGISGIIICVCVCVFFYLSKQRNVCFLYSLWKTINLNGKRSHKSVAICAFLSTIYMYVAGLSAESYCLAVLRIRDINGIFENGLCYFATSKVDEFYSNALVRDKNTVMSKFKAYDRWWLLSFANNVNLCLLFCILVLYVYKRLIFCYNSCYFVIVGDFVCHSFIFHL